MVEKPRYEQELTAFGGKLRGRPDAIVGEEVVDYKSGAVTEYDEEAQCEVVKSAYVRQLQIYAVLVHETLGYWPKRGTLLTMQGARVEVALTPSACKQAAEEAVALLDEYNAKICANASWNTLAQPSVDACRWCSCKVICPAFWTTANPDWSGHLDGGAVEGVIAAEPAALQDGTSVSIVLDVEAGSEQRRRAAIGPFAVSTHMIAKDLVAGDRVRLVGLRLRKDGSLVPSQSTILVKPVDMPKLSIGPAPAASG